MPRRTKTTSTGRLIERGNGFSNVGDYVTDGDDLYLITRVFGGIETTGRQGNWMRAEVEEADWDDVPSRWESRCLLALDDVDDDDDDDDWDDEDYA